MQGFGAKAEINYVEGYPVVENAADAVALAAGVATELVGKDHVAVEFPRMMGSGDFAHMLQARPGALIRIGKGPSEGGRGLHNPSYDFDHANLTVGAAFWSRLAERFLS